MLKHLDNRSDFATDEEFANFRNLILNNSESSKFFRSASCIKNTYGRRETVKKIMEEKSIHTIIDISHINERCMSKKFGQELVVELSKILVEPEPYIIQCEAGKKRTGFACILLEMLSGTDYSHIVNDYLISYVNNNGINISQDGYFVDTIVKKINKIIQFISNTEDDIANIDFIQSAKAYLAKFGLTGQEIIMLQQKLKN